VTDHVEPHLARSQEPHRLARGRVHIGSLCGWEVSVGSVKLQMVDYGIRGMVDVDVTVVDDHTVSVRI